MKTKTLIQLAVMVSMVAASSLACATDDGENIIYFGAGGSRGGHSLGNGGGTAISLGYLRVSNASNIVWGADVSGEGTMLDSTGGNTNKAKRATSFNLLAGANIGKYESNRFDAALVLGAREKTSHCPNSYLGYQCYANSDPKNSYDVNYGLVLTWAYKSVMLGVRATGESTQALFGFRF
jgi:hypothetical protein